MSVLLCRREQNFTMKLVGCFLLPAPGPPNLRPWLGLFVFER